MSLYGESKVEEKCNGEKTCFAIKSLNSSYASGTQAGPNCYFATISKDLLVWAKCV